MPTNYSHGGGLPTAATDLLAWTAVASAAQQLTSELTCTGFKYARLGIFYGLDSATAPVGTQILIQKSSTTSGNADWITIDSIVTGTTAPTATTTDNTEAGPVMECDANVPALNDMVFFKNATIANSEIGTVVARVTTGGSETFTLRDALTTSQAAGTYYSRAEKYDRLYLVAGAQRIRGVVNNNYVASEPSCCVRITCTLEN